MTYGKLVLNTHMEYGQIDEGEFDKIKGIFDKRIEDLSYSGISWNKPDMAPI